MRVEITEQKIEQLPFSNLEWVADLLYYEGPILTHVQSETGQNYFSYWVDVEDNLYRWVMFRVSNYNLKCYLAGKISLRELMLSTSNELVYIIDMQGDNYVNVFCILPNRIPNQYLPEKELRYKTSSLTEEIYTKFFTNVANESAEKKGFDPKIIALLSNFPQNQHLLPIAS